MSIQNSLVQLMIDSTEKIVNEAMVEIKEKEKERLETK